jgi:hypothetical protein
MFTFGSVFWPNMVVRCGEVSRLISRLGKCMVCAKTEVQTIVGSHYVFFLFPSALSTASQYHSTKYATSGTTGPPLSRPQISQKSISRDENVPNNVVRTHASTCLY